MLSAGQLNEKLRSFTDLGVNSTLQQNYSLLDEEEVSMNLTIPYTCTIPGKTIEALAVIPWRRVYTLNIDNAFEKYSRALAEQKMFSAEVISSFNFNELYKEITPESIHSIVHLHGDVAKPSSGYVFSHTEYAHQMARANSWMLTLTQLMKSEPFIVAGTTLDEIDVQYYLQQHEGVSPEGGINASSILIEPFPNRLTKKVCRDHNLILFEGTTLDFLNSLQSEFTDFHNPFSSFGPQNEYPTRLSAQEKVLFESSFEKVRASVAASKDGTRFLLGAPLTWELIQSDADIPRSAISSVEREIDKSLKGESQGVVYLADPGSGKSALLKRVAFRASQKYRNVFFYSNSEKIGEEKAAEIFSSFNGDVVVFFDDVADSASYLVGILHAIKKSNICFICIERSYRKPYLSDALVEQDVEVRFLDLDVTKPEAKKLLKKNEECGLSDVSQKSELVRNSAMAEVLKNPIAIANCRIQNNFLAFDQIVRGMLADSAPDELKFFVLAALARYAYAGGVSKAVLHSIPGRGSFTQVDNIYCRFPVVAAAGAPGYVVPARAAVSERVLEVLRNTNPELLLDCLVELCNRLAPRVNRDTVKSRTPEAKLSGGLMDFDRTVQRFINDQAEAFYQRIAEDWDWNSRYWEQLALMRLSRFLEDNSDPFLLQEAIQNARYAYSIDEHPLSLTTLAKALFTALDTGTGDRDSVFAEGWNLIYKAIQIEKGWTRVKPTAFIVAFKGVRAFFEKGGQLSGQQADELRESLAITHQRKLKDRKLSELREEVKALV